MEAQSSKLESYAFEAFHRRDQLIDAAYEALNLFVSELLTYADGDTDIGSKNLPTPTYRGGPLQKSGKVLRRRR
jgi:hypothetical protein